jgi:hypothetical protein
LGEPVTIEENCTVTEGSLILPSSFLGSRAWASEQVADALAICRDFGNPSLFITFTTNPNWPEIKSQLRFGQTASDVPDVACRVFKQKMEQAITWMKKHFGRMIYLVKVVEFQKHGLLHCHMVIKVCTLSFYHLQTNHWIYVLTRCRYILSYLSTRYQMLYQANCPPRRKIPS